MGAKGASVVTIHDRVEAYRKQGLYISDLKNGLTMCSLCNCVVNWKKKSTVNNHFDSAHHKEKSRKQEASKAKAKKQPSIVTSVSEAEKLKSAKDDLNRSLIKACLKANIPLHKLSNPAVRQWLVANVKGGGDIVSTYWLRQKYLPEIKVEYEEDIKALVKGKDIVVMIDETTNRKGEAVLITLFKILPSESNAAPILVVPSVDVLLTCSADTCSNAVIKSLNKYDVLYENVKGLSSDSAPYMIKCARLLQELVNPDLIHITCWDHKLDKVSKVFSSRLPRLNECVKKTKKFFKNTRKRRNNYKNFLKEKYHFTKAKDVKRRLDPGCQADSAPPRAFSHSEYIVIPRLL